jgi:hypothetical protein
MRHKFFVFCAALVVVLLALAPLTQGQKAGTSPAVPLRVTVEPMDSMSTPCRICGDGLGINTAIYQNPNEYVDGIDGVSASFTKYGWLSISFQESASLRTVNFDYSLTGNPIPPPVLPIYSPKVTSGVDPNTILQNMLIGTTHCIPLGWSYTDGSNITRNHGFQFGPHVTGSSYAIINCAASDNTGQCIRWVVEPKVDGTCNANASVAGINDRIVTRGKATDYDRGRFTMPFKLTLLRK